MIDMPVDLNNTEKESYAPVWIQIDNLIDMVCMWHHPALILDDITRLARDIAIIDSAQIVVVVRVVNSASLNLAGTPAECGVAGCAVHLITPVNLENPRGALGTRPSVLGEQTSRLDILWSAHVLVSSLDLVTGWTNLGIAHATLPTGRQETATVVRRTGPNKLAPRTNVCWTIHEELVMIIEIHTFTIDKITL